MYWYNQMYRIFEPNQYVWCILEKQKTSMLQVFPTSTPYCMAATAMQMAKKNTLYSPLTLYADENRPAKNSGVMQCHEQIIAVTRENASLHALELKGEGSVKSNNIRDKKRT